MTKVNERILTLYLPLRCSCPVFDQPDEHRSRQGNDSVQLYHILM